jgi:hypothetical protein
LEIEAVPATIITKKKLGFVVEISKYTHHASLHHRILNIWNKTMAVFLMFLMVVLGLGNS